MIPLHDDNPTDITPLLTWALIIACVVAFALQLSAGQDGNRGLIFAFGLIPAVVTGSAELPPQLALLPPAATLLSSMFLHGGWLHLGGNLLYLWIFGNNVEDAMGHIRFIVFYLLCGLAAAGAQIVQDPASAVPMIGASGAISGVLGAYLLLYPRASVLVAIPLGFILPMVRLPAALVLGLWFALQFLSSLSAPPGQPGVAWWAHIGGFIAGCVLVWFFKDPRVPLLQTPRRHRP